MIKGIAIFLLAAVLFAVASCSSEPKGPEVRFLGDDEVTEMPVDFFEGVTSPCWLGDTIYVWDNPYYYHGVVEYLYMGKSTPREPICINGKVVFPIVPLFGFDSHVYQAVVVSIK